MKSPAFILFTVIALVVLGFLLWPAFDQDEPERPAQAPSSVEPSATSANGSRVSVLKRAPEFELTDQGGAAYGSAQLQGKVWIVNFMFTRCTSTCPLQTARLAEAQATLRTDPVWDGIRFVSITVDPEFDSAEVLQQYAAGYQADPEHWKFLTGTREAIWQLSADGFGLPVRDDAQNAQMPILHDPRFIVVDRLGQVRGVFNSQSPAAIVELRKTLQFIVGEIAPPAEWSEEFPTSAETGVQQITHLIQPPEVADTEWLQRTKQTQLATRDQFSVFWDFQYQDRRAASGIDFQPQIVDEQRWRLQVNHYDHGNGVCVADVDGDGRYDIYFVSQAGANSLWRNLGEGRFEDITEQSGVGVSERIGVTASFADIDNDGDADLYVTTVRGGNILFVNDGAGRFTDQTETSGLDFVGHSSASVFFDYDRDGLLDMFLCNVGQYTTDEFAPLRVDRTSSLVSGTQLSYYVGTKDAFAGHLKDGLTERSLLFHNEGGLKFQEVSESMGLVDEGWSGDATPVDVNGDGWLDLYVLNMQGNDQYYESQGGKSFVRKSREVFPRTPWGAMGVKAFDFENDGDVDLMVTDMHSDMSKDVGPALEKQKSDMQWPESFLQSDNAGIFGNALFRSDGAGTFSEDSDELGAENYWPWGLSIGDLNADGFQDAFVASSMCFPYRYAVNSVLLNDRGQRFRAAEFILGVEPRPGGRLTKPWFSLDASGADRKHPISAGREGTIVVWSALGSRSSVLFDFDDDGDLDIITNDFNSEPLVLASDLSARATAFNYLKIKLVGSRSNRDALGATVRVVTGEMTQTRYHDGKSGYLSQSLLPLYFGLGTADTVDRIEVVWPGGQTTSIDGPIKSNQLQTIQEQ
jgi:cytochrome oxidase Cu insertion factor (SCO1/SenC/PrrC family)/PAS domain-containing protein